MAHLRRISRLAPLVRGSQAATTSGQSGVAVGAAFEANSLWRWTQARHNSTTASAAAASAASSDLAAAAHAPLHLDLSPSPPPDLFDPSLSLAAAHSSLEDSLWLFLSPTQLGVQFWEAAHAATGLPWWAALPAATLALRAALLPLSLKAYAASANVVLLHRAVGLSRQVADAVAAAAAQLKEEQEKQGREQQSGAAGEGSGSGTSSGSAAVSGGGGDGGAASLGRVELVRRVLAHLRAVHGAPSFGWYLGNAAVQVPLAVSLTLALRRMSDTLWPGLTGEGALYFPDLTAPPMYLQTLSTPYGTAGAILPLAVVLLYISAVDRSAGGRSPGIHTALKLLVLPLYCAAVLQPHAVLLYWLALPASQLAIYELVARVPALRRAARVPDVMLQPSAAAGAGEADKAVVTEGTAESAGVEKEKVPFDELLLALSDSYGKAGNTAAARSCLQALLARQPGHPGAAERLEKLTLQG